MNENDIIHPLDTKLEYLKKVIAKILWSKIYQFILLESDLS